MRSEDIKTLPENQQLLVLEVMRFVEEMKLLRQEIGRLRRAITDEIE